LEEVFLMQTAYALLAALLLASAMVSVALAEQHEKGTAEDASHSAAAVAPENIKDGHTLTGTITQIDYRKGTVSLQTEQEALVLSFPPAMVKAIRKAIG
jgi:hypothetical protein